MMLLGQGAGVSDDAIRVENGTIRAKKGLFICQKEYF